MNDLYDDTITTIPLVFTPVKLSTFLRFAAARENESFSLPTGWNLRVHLQSYMEVAFFYNLMDHLTNTPRAGKTVKMEIHLGPTADFVHA
jgi:hypothetical protein